MEEKDFSKFVESAFDKAKEIGETAKLYAMIKAEEAKKQEQYYRLGKKYYELFADTPERDLAGYVNKLKQSDEKIAKYREEIKKNDDSEEATDVEAEIKDVEEAVVDSTED